MTALLMTFINNKHYIVGPPSLLSLGIGFGTRKSAKAI